MSLDINREYGTARTLPGADLRYDAIRLRTIGYTAVEIADALDADVSDVAEMLKPKKRESVAITRAEEIRRAYLENGKSIPVAARECGLSESVVYRSLKSAGLIRPKRRRDMSDDERNGIMVEYLLSGRVSSAAKKFRRDRKTVIAVLAGKGIEPHRGHGKKEPVGAERKLVQMLILGMSPREAGEVLGLTERTAGCAINRASAYGVINIVRQMIAKGVLNVSE